ncbi:UNVERIFIED_CONTAM: hypothetical protein Sangu_1119100 [Sesamum angustifolium]|uniref:Uncharacterized protein n=1 Tax=Sesamum angustifolium TaxID=2727405 RepID=A0AAW2P081_9LAMI
MVRADEIIKSIIGELRELPSAYPNPCIFKDNLRSAVERDNVYDPEIVAIGFYNHNKDYLEDMQIYKLMYLKRFLGRKYESDNNVNDVPATESANSTNNVTASMERHPFFSFYVNKGKKVVEETAGSSTEAIAGSSVDGVGRENKNADKIVKAVVGMEERARKWYGGRVDPARGSDFVKMLVIDGCFLIELLRCYGLDNWRDLNDPIFKYERMLSQLRHDIVLNENQIPFFVLNDLFNMSRSKDPKDDLILLTLNFVKGMFLDLSVPEEIEFKKPDHLLGLIRDVWVLPFANNNAAAPTLAKWENIKSASELHRTGIDFKISKDHNSLMDITFVRKCLGAKLKIPQLNIYYETESQIRNLVAYEQYLPYGNPRYVSDYTFFMHCLINTSEDVELLRRGGIIGNWLGNDEEVCLMFNRQGTSILTSSNFSYSQLFSEVNRHYHSHRKKWWAELWREYFDGPWACAKFLAALALLGLAILQTIFTIYPYYHPRK